MKSLHRSEAGGSVFLVLVAIALLWGGGQGVYTVLTNLKPTEMTYADFVQSKPSKKWLLLKNCELTLLDAMYSQSRLSDTIKEVYIPVHVSAVNDTGTVHCLFATKDPKIISLVSRFSKIQSEVELLKFAAENREALWVKRDIQGLVRFGIELKDKEKRKLTRVGENLAADFIIVDDGQKPAAVVSAVLFLAGLALSGWIVFGFFRKPSPPALPTPIPGSGPPPAIQ
jgi:hypothetical protein